jgi:hypothetical protein
VFTVYAADSSKQFLNLVYEFGMEFPQLGKWKEK